MKILYLRREPPGASALAIVNVELPCGVKLFGIKVKERSGRYYVHAPNAGGAGVVTFPPAVVEEVAALTRAELERTPHDSR
ncbi:MAG: hypothetical protein F9K19_10520 [Rhizobiaceae bacterium]|nr:MAG: hypothetical protein F9K19_10520 [Rhizobiaceae bacterium]CAG0956739.1 hypothetical protein RHIZO_00485 [Rhizobiaceae bacterium]